MGQVGFEMVQGSGFGVYRFRGLFASRNPKAQRRVLNLLATL